MPSNPLDALLERLCSGDAEAAERVFVEYEPYLRLVVRRMLPATLRPKFDSVDVVHSIWADLLHGFRESGWRFKDAAHLRGFLVKATRNRFMDRLRKHRAAVETEETEIAGEVEQVLGSDPRPSEIAVANDLWARMLALCPAQHRPLLQLKRQGLSLQDIAARTGYHPSSVRRVFYDLARKLATEGQQDKAPADA